MGLRDDIQTDLAEAFDDDLSDAVTAFTGTRYGVEVFFDIYYYFDSAKFFDKSAYLLKNYSYRGEDDWMLPPGEPLASTLTYTGRGVFTDYSKYELDSDIIDVTDVKLICLANEITNEPIADDKINGYSVVMVNKDPANATYEIQLRQV
ncbi:hypothetical protein FQV37_2280 [Psychrobacter nivimaris]|uniref:Uncharacterized protein n=1 Tax=Psychrobacter nivimaris TaxID=281738 RepID=A0A6N7BUT7_9GAMM|nr:glutamate 5-kinase [Psychrobacter nivimaris]KAF0567424.1 hypothetical protein FQV37_2280 [Psychrobacter nivimaris]